MWKCHILNKKNKEKKTKKQHNKTLIKQLIPDFHLDRSATKKLILDILCADVTLKY